MSDTIIGLGAGGHAKVVIEMIRERGGFEIVGLLDANPARWGGDVLGVRVLGGDEQLLSPALASVTRFFVGVGSVGNTSARRAVFERGLASGRHAVTVVHPRAIVSPDAVIGAGTVVMAGAIVNPGVVIGVNVIVNTGAIIDHDCTIGDHSHVATGARLSGTVTAGAGVHIGVGASVRQSIRIGAGAVVGAGAAVVADVPPGAVVVGVPARQLASRLKGAGQ